MRKVVIIIGIILVILIIVIIAIFLIKNEPEPASNIINVSQAYEICNEESCPTEEITIEGGLTRSSSSNPAVFILTDPTNISLGLASSLKGHSKSIYVKFKPEITSLLKVIEENEKNNLLKGGIVKARVKGLISYEYEPVRDFHYIEMNIGLDDIEYIENIRCRKKDEGHIIPGIQENCFDFSMYELKASEAYKNLMKSAICRKNGREASGYFDYDFEEDYWRFGINSQEKGNDNCYISKDKIIFKRTCPAGMIDCSEISLAEAVNPKSFEEIYEECVNEKSSEIPELGPAEDEPIGATREDNEGNVWIKQENGMWITNVEKYKGISWGNELIDENTKEVRKYDDIDCEIYLEEI